MKKPIKNRPGLLDSVAAKGRGGDNTIAHLTTGEIVVPLRAQTPELRQQLMGILAATGHDPERYVVGGADDSKNPRTGILEFGYGSDTDGGADQGVGGSDSSGGGGRGTSEGGRDEGDRAREADTGRAPAPPGPQGEEQIADDINDSTKRQMFSPSFTQNPFGWIGDAAKSKIADIRDNPAAFGLNTAFGLVGGPLGALNSFSALVGGPTLGGLATQMAGNLTDKAAAPTGLNAGAQPGPSPDFDPPGTPADSMGLAGQVNPNTGAPFQPQQTAQQVAQQALQRALIYKPQAYNKWQGNNFVIPGILG